MPNHPIIDAYNELKDLFARSALSNEVTEKLVQVFELCQEYLYLFPKVELSCGTSITRKRYFAYNNDSKYSRPVNVDLFEDGLTDFLPVIPSVGGMVLFRGAFVCAEGIFASALQINDI